IPGLDILCYSLTKYNFHLIVKTSNDYKQDLFGNALGLVLRSYARAVNIQEERVGSLFRQNSKKTVIGHDSFKLEAYLRLVLRQPMFNNSIKSLFNWPHSSFHSFYNASY